MTVSVWCAQCNTHHVTEIGAQQLAAKARDTQMSRLV